MAIIRLNKYLAQTGHCSRREADAFIAQGRVTVNGKVAEMGHVLQQPYRAKITVDGQPVVMVATKLVYGMFYKPNGTLTTRHDDQGRRTIYDCLPPKVHHLKPVGRLDRNSSGLLLMTNDGELHYRATQAKFHLPKVYQVRIEPAIQDASPLAKGLLAGVLLEPENVMATVEEVYQLGPDTLGITLVTGYNRQVRRMLAHFGYEVKQLKRIAIGPIKLNQLKLGEYRPLTAEEVTLLKTALHLPLRVEKTIGQAANTVTRTGQSRFTTRSRSPLSGASKSDRPAFSPSPNPTSERSQTRVDKPYPRESRPKRPTSDAQSRPPRSR